MKGIVVIPAFNEAKVIKKVISKIPSEIFGHRLDNLVINDGSTDNTQEILLNLHINHVTHQINRGLGAALGTGFEYARNNNYDFLITLDGDGQHDPDEISRLIKPVIISKIDFVVGTRFSQKGMPASRKIITFLASLITYFFTGVWTTDSQSGFRAFSKKAIENIDIDVDRMEVSSDFFRQAKEKNLEFAEIPIRAIYTKYSLKKGQNFFNSANIVGKLALKSFMR